MNVISTEVNCNYQRNGNFTRDMISSFIVNPKPISLCPNKIYECTLSIGENQKIVQLFAEHICVLVTALERQKVSGFSSSFVFSGFAAALPPLPSAEEILADIFKN